MGSKDEGSPSHLVFPDCLNETDFLDFLGLQASAFAACAAAQRADPGFFGCELVGLDQVLTPFLKGHGDSR